MNDSSIDDLEIYVNDYIEALLNIGCTINLNTIKVKLPSKDIYIASNYNLIDIMLYPNNLIKICRDINTNPPIKFIQKYKTQGCKNCCKISTKYCLCDDCEILVNNYAKNIIINAFLKANKDSYFKECIYDLIYSKYFHEFLNENSIEEQKYNHKELITTIKKKLKR